MRTTTRLLTGMLLASSALLTVPLASAANQGGYDAFEELSGTHASAKWIAPEGMRGSEGTKGEMGMAGSKTAQPAYDAYEELSGTHPTPAAVKASMRGSSGLQGETGGAGKVNSGWSPYNTPGDVADACSKYLRCSSY
jgi:hypothetical protein